MFSAGKKQSDLHFDAGLRKVEKEPRVFMMKLIFAIVQVRGMLPRKEQCAEQGRWVLGNGNERTWVYLNKHKWGKRRCQGWTTIWAWEDEEFYKIDHTFHLRQVEFSCDMNPVELNISWHIRTHSYCELLLLLYQVDSSICNPRAQRKEVGLTNRHLEFTEA